MATVIRKEMVDAWETLDFGFRVAMICTDNAGTVTHWSPYAVALYGWKREDVLGRNIRELTVGPATAEIAEEIMANLVAGGHWEGEFQATRADGTEIEVHVVDMPLLEGDEQIGICGLSIDVTAQRHAWRRRLDESMRMFDAAERAREAERARVGREMHDEIGQTVTALRTELLGITERSEPGDATTERLHQAIQLTDDVLASVRRILFDMRPPLLDQAGLTQAIEGLGAAFTDRTGVPCAVDVPADLPPLGRDHELELFRIVQESLTNIERHAQAANVAVSIHCDDELVLAVTDDGAGVGSHPEAGGIGIMHGRARRLGGTLTVEPAEPPRTGTIVTLRWRPPFVSSPS